MYIWKLRAEKAAKGQAQHDDKIVPGKRRDQRKKTLTGFAISLVVTMCDRILEPHRHVLEFAFTPLNPLTLAVFVISDQLRLQRLSIGSADKMTRDGLLPATGAFAVLFGRCSALGRN